MVKTSTLRARASNASMKVVPTADSTTNGSTESARTSTPAAPVMDPSIARLVVDARTGESSGVESRSTTDSASLEAIVAQEAPTQLTTQLRRLPFYEYANLGNGASPFSTITRHGGHTFAGPLRPRPVSESFASSSTPTASTPFQLSTLNGENLSPLPLLPPKILEPSHNSNSNLDIITAEPVPDPFLDRQVYSSIPQLASNLPPAVGCIKPSHQPSEFAAGSKLYMYTPWGTITSSPHFSKPAFGVPAFQSMAHAVQAPNNLVNAESDIETVDLNNGNKVEDIEILAEPCDACRLRNTKCDAGKPSCESCLENCCYCTRPDRLENSKEWNAGPYDEQANETGNLQGSATSSLLSEGNMSVRDVSANLGSPRKSSLGHIDAAHRTALEAELANARKQLTTVMIREEITGEKLDVLRSFLLSDIQGIQIKLVGGEAELETGDVRKEKIKAMINDSYKRSETWPEGDVLVVQWFIKKWEQMGWEDRTYVSGGGIESGDAEAFESGLEREKRDIKPEIYTQPFCDFLSENPTVFHAVNYFGKRLETEGFLKLSERSLWTEELEKGGRYYVTRNGSSLIAFTVGSGYKPGNGVAMIVGHVDAITARLKPVSSKRTTAGYVQLGVAPYAGGLNPTWWDRDLSIGGKVLVKDLGTGKVSTQLVKLNWPIARVPTLAPHFGVGMMGQQNPETQAVPIIGLDSSSAQDAAEDLDATTIGGVAKAFVATQPPRLVKAIAGELKIQDTSSIVNWELELFDLQPATVGGLEKDFIFGGRIDDKLCSYAAIEALLASSPPKDCGAINMVALFDDEEIGSLLRQGARGNFMPSVIERIVESFAPIAGPNIMAQTYARSFLISADVTHAVNPNFMASYLEGHAPRLNVGPAVHADSNGHTTTDAVSTAFLSRVAEKCGSTLQVFMIRNDSRSGGTVGPTLSSTMGVRSVDCGIPQLSMHSIRATTGSLDPGLGVKLYKGFFDHFEAVDEEFAE